MGSEKDEVQPLGKRRWVERAGRQGRLSQESYLRGIVDYVKWTSTLAGAGVLWVGNAALGLSGWAQVVGRCGLLLLLASLIVALFALWKVLGAWEGQWAADQAASEFAALCEFEDLVRGRVPAEGVGEIEEAVLEAGNEMTELISAAASRRDVQMLRRWVIGHVALLVVGLCMYGVAQLLGA